MLKLEELIEDKIYYCKDYSNSAGNNYLFRFDKITKSRYGYNINVKSIIGLDNAVYCRNNIHFNEEHSGFGGSNKVINATKEQINHLEACEAAGKYIEYYYYNSNETIPEIDEILKESIKTNNLNL